MPAPTSIPQVRQRPTPTPSPARVGEFRAEYYRNPFLQGRPVLVRNEPMIHYNWDRGSPGEGVSNDNFSVRWVGRFDFADGNYAFTVTTDDGMRVRVDDKLCIDSWKPQRATVHQCEIFLTQGMHTVKVEYFELGDRAVAQVSWELIPQPTLSLTATPTPEPTATLVSTATPTPEPTATLVPTAIPTPLPTPTLSPTATPTPEPTVTPVATSVPAATLKPVATQQPAAPILMATPVPTPVSGIRVKGNEIVLMGEMSVGAKLWPGAPQVFQLFIGGCGCDRSVDIKFSPKQGDLRTEVRLETLLGPAVPEDKVFAVPNNGITVYVVVWADPGTLPFRVDDIKVEMKQNNQRVDLVEVARDLFVPESIPASLTFYNYSEERGLVFGVVQMRNLGQTAQTVYSFEVKEKDCGFPVISKAQFFKGGTEIDPKNKVEIPTSSAFVLSVQMTVPAGEELVPGTLFCKFSFKRELQQYALTPDGVLVAK